MGEYDDEWEREIHRVPEDFRPLPQFPTTTKLTEHQKQAGKQAIAEARRLLRGRKAS